MLALAACGRIDFSPASGVDAAATTDATPGIPGICGVRTAPTVAMGAETTCLTRLDGTLWCTGTGYGTTFRQADASTRWLRVDAEETTFCALDVACELSCWGVNMDGEVGAGDTLPHPAPTPITPGIRYRDLGAGGFHTCAIREDGTLWCWGRNLEGELGLGDFQPRDAPVQVGTATWRAIARGYLFTCALATDDALWCWGANDEGQLGLGDATVGTNQPSPQIVASPPSPWAVVSAGKQHICGLDQAHGLWCWGLDNLGEVGRGDTQPYHAPVPVDAATDWAVLGAGRFATCAIKTDHTLWCWGDNSSDEVGIPSVTSATSPTQLQPARDWAFVPQGNSSSCAFDATGALWCWGANDTGQLGVGDTMNRGSPTQVPLP